MNAADLPIPKPCDADWAAMTLAERGRFCGDCRKVVRELAQLTEREARALLAAPPTEGLCVRYIHDATGEILFRDERLVAPTHLARARRLATALALATLPLTACTPTTAAPPAVVRNEPPPEAVLMGAPVAPPPTTTVTTPPPAAKGP